MGENTEKTFFIIAGEHSGDLFASFLVKNLKKVHKERGMDQDLHFVGLGGDNLKKAGVDLFENIVETLAIVGIIEVFVNFTKIYSLLSRVKEYFKNTPPDAVILVDYPGFNLKIARLAHDMGIPVYYYICPQVWAWGEKRVTSIINNVDLLFTIFSFEIEKIRQSKYFGKADQDHCDIHFIGHPLLDILKSAPGNPEEVRETFNIDPSKKIIGLLPGSRSSEIRRLLPVMLKSAAIIRDLYKDVQFIIPIAPTISRSLIDLHLQQENMTKVVKVVNDLDYNLRRIMDFAIVTSGTATLEMAFLEVPMVIVYKMHSVGYFLAKQLIHIKYIGLVNILFEDQIVPECIQYEANEKKVSQLVLNYLTQSSQMENIRKRLRKVKEKVQPAPELQEEYHSISPSYCAAHLIWDHFSEKAL